ncbi:hypothetical protein [Jiangella mangrovi]|uniref:Uncharacterized protein n=1 Tax=Jiangella mangrovi TaxID=1524084 RepID=A0A7W9GXA9_9ACTN|nr:hypothetical protein [Jiangella mangrovi]MBB5791777.1 hypothetical protein [Jiangella mangrovi]
MAAKTQADTTVLDLLAEALRGLTSAPVEIEPDPFTAPAVPGVRIFARGGVELDPRTGVLAQGVQVVQYAADGSQALPAGSLGRARGQFADGELVDVAVDGRVQRASLPGAIEAVASTGVARVLPRVPSVARTTAEGVGYALGVHLHSLSSGRVNVATLAAAESGDAFVIGLQMTCLGELTPAQVADWAAEAVSGVVGRTVAGVGRVKTVEVVKRGRLDQFHGGIEARVVVETA